MSVERFACAGSARGCVRSLGESQLPELFVELQRRRCYPYFIDKKTEAQGGKRNVSKVTELVKPGFELWQLQSTPSS